MKKAPFLLLILLPLVVFPQTVYWTETTQSDFADGYIDPNLYASFRIGLEAPVYRGAVEWFPRFDLDGNGYPDFISPDFNCPCSLRVWFMGPTGLDHMLGLPMSAPGGDCDFADLDWDGDAEIIHSGYWGGNTVIYWNSGGTFSASDTTLIPNDDGEAVYVADLDADGYLDIVVGGDNNQVNIYWGTMGVLRPWGVGPRTTFTVFSGICHNIECADLDNDADLDLLVLYLEGNRPLLVFRNLGGRAFDIDTLILQDVSPDWHHGLSVGDLNRDGFIDVVVTDCNYTGSAGDLTEIFINDGVGFSAPVTSTLQLHPGPSYGGSALHDFNGDGWLDIIFFRSHGAGSLKVCLNSGGATPLFSDADCYTIGPYVIDATGGTVIDANDDGNADIFVNVGDPPAGYSLLLWGPAFVTCDSFPNNYDHHGIFREPGNIRDRSKSAFYESNVFDTGFEHGACSGSVSWIAYDERDYSGGTLPVPLGSEVIVLARGGDTPLPDASWTPWDTLVDGAPLPPTILGHRYYQYRAELWYSNPAYLPWLQQIEFAFDPCSCPEVDSVWFWEETERDGENLVVVCYTASDADGDSFFVELEVFDDTAAVPVHTIYDTASAYLAPNVGWVLNGTHCFVWDMGADYADREGCDFTARITVNNETTELLVVSDSFAFRNPEGIAFDGEYLWISSIATPYSDTVVVYKVDPATHEILDSCAFYDVITNMYADMEWHNDTLYMMQASGRQMFVVDPSGCVVVDSSDGLWGSGRWGQGIAWHDGYLWVNDSHGLIYRVDPFPPYDDTLWISVEDTFLAYHGDSLFSGSVTADAMVFAFGYIWILRNPAGGITHILFQVDSTGQVVDSFALPAAGTYGPEGLTFDGSCFWYTDHANDMVYRVCLWGCSDTFEVTGCLDSRKPRVVFDPLLCGDSLATGASYTISWAVDDSFFVPGTDCSLWIVCGADTQFLGAATDTSLDFVVPYMPCDSAVFIAVTYDSFGNRGVEVSCPFVILPCASALCSLVCPTSFGFVSCTTAYAGFHIVDTTGAEIDTARAFLTVLIFHEAGGVDTLRISTPSPFVSWIGAGDEYDLFLGYDYADADSVQITLDSLFNVAGCRILP